MYRYVRNETNCVQNKKIVERLQPVRKGQINQKEDLGKGLQEEVYLFQKPLEILDHTEESPQSTILSLQAPEKKGKMLTYDPLMITKNHSLRNVKILKEMDIKDYSLHFDNVVYQSMLQALEKKGKMLTYDSLEKLMTDRILRKVKIRTEMDTNDYVVNQSKFIEQTTTYIKVLGELYMEIIGIIESLRLRYSSALLNVKNLIPIVTLSLEHLKGTLKVLQHMPSVTWVSNFDELLPAIRTLRQKTVISNEYRERLHSFVLGQNERNKNWNNDKFLWPGPLVAAGFSYEGEDDIVVCKYCNCRSDTTRWTDNDENYDLKMHREGQKGPCHFLEAFGGAQLNSEDSHAHKKKRWNTKG